MNDCSPFIDGRVFLVGSPFRSGWFALSTGLGIGAVVADIVILYRYWQVLNAGIVVALCVPVGAHLIYQWWRLLKYYARIRSLYLNKSANEAKEGAPLDLALRIASGGLVNLLFYCNGIALVLLVLIGVCLEHFSRIR